MQRITSIMTNKKLTPTAKCIAAAAVVVVARLRMENDIDKREKI